MGCNCCDRKKRIDIKPMRLLHLELNYKFSTDQINKICYVWNSEIAERYSAISDFYYCTKKQVWKYYSDHHISQYNELLGYLVWQKPYIPKYSNAALDMLLCNVRKNIYVLLQVQSECENNFICQNSEQIKKLIYNLLTIDSTGELCYYPTRTDDMIIFSLTQTKR